MYYIIECKYLKKPNGILLFYTFSTSVLQILVIHIYKVFYCDEVIVQYIQNAIKSQENSVWSEEKGDSFCSCQDFN